MDHERAGDSKELCRVVGTEFLVLSEDSDTFALEEMAECSLKQRRGLRPQPDDLVLARLAPDPDFYLIALAELVEGFGRLAVLIRELDKLQHMGSHGRFPLGLNTRSSTSNQAC